MYVDDNLERLSDLVGFDDFIRIYNLHEKFSWLENEPMGLCELWRLADNGQQKNLIEELINNFNHVSSSQLLKIGNEISSHIVNEWKLESHNSYLSATCDNSKPDGSQTFIQSLKNKFPYSWRESNFYNSLPVAANNIKDNSTLILVDDFIGTGNTIDKKIKYVQDTLSKRQLKKIKLKVVSIAAMEFSKSILNHLDIEYHSHYWLKKGISEMINNPTLRQSYIEEMTNLEYKLKKHNSRKVPNFGYMKSEALFALEAYNIPNNVFPIFWWPYLKDQSEERITIFRRV